MEAEKWTVYCHTAPNGKKYVGITSKNPEIRWNNGNGYRANKHFFAAIKKYGWNNISHEILAEVYSKDLACELEKRFIETYDSANPKKGYNNTLGGEFGVKHTDFVKEALSKKQKENWNIPEYRENMVFKHTGKKHSAKTKEKMRMVHAPENITEEQRKKMSAASKGRKYINRKGHLHTEESKKKISQSKKGIYAGGKGKEPRKIICVETKQIFESVKSASEIVGATPSGIYRCCSKERETAKKFHWEFLDVYMAEKP